MFLFLLTTPQGTERPRQHWLPSPRSCLVNCPRALRYGWEIRLENVQRGHPSWEEGIKAFPLKAKGSVWLSKNIGELICPGLSWEGKWRL